LAGLAERGLERQLMPDTEQDSEMILAQVNMPDAGAKWDADCFRHDATSLPEMGG
jgi:hypothetical protein